MAGNTYRFEVITAQKLQSFAEKRIDPTQWQGLIPISRKRSLAQARNPHAAPADPVLLLAFEGRRCIGYHGLLPGLLKNKTRFSKVFWATTFFVDDAYRGRGLGRHIIERIKSLKIDFMVTGMTRAAERAYLAAGVNQAGSVAFYQLNADQNKPDRSSGSHFVTRESLRNEPPLQAVLGKFLDQFGLDCKLVDRLSHNKKLQNFKSSDRVEFFRDIEFINWMITFPWIYSGDTSQANNQSYYFSSQRDRFEYIVIEFYAPNTNAWMGFMVFSLSHHKQRTVLKALDHCLIPSVNPAVFLETTLFMAKQIGVDRMEHQADWHTDSALVSAPDFTVKKKKRSYCYYAGNPQGMLRDTIPAIYLNYCDGDAPFT